MAWKKLNRAACGRFCDFQNVVPVSYTHLDVYKRQGLYRAAVLLPVQDGQHGKGCVRGALTGGDGYRKIRHHLRRPAVAV